MIGIRPMTAEDTAAAAGLEAQAFSEPWSEEAFRETLQYDYAYYYVACIFDSANAGDNDSIGIDSNSVIGICGLRNIAGEGEITNVAVREDCRRQGVAETLLKEVLKKGSELGIQDFTLEVRSGNTAAIRLYEKLGFKNEGIRKNFYANPTEDAVIMWKR